LNLSHCFDILNEYGVQSINDISLLNDEDWKEIKLKPLEKRKISTAVNKDKNISSTRSTSSVSSGNIIQYLNNRQNLCLNESLLPQGSIDITNWKPKGDCIEELRNLKGLEGMDKLGLIVSECKEWIDAFMTKPNSNTLDLDENEIFSLVIYSHDLKGKGNQEENFYFQLNQMLRKRTPQTYEKWKGYLFYMQNALKKLENQKITVYRGIPVSEKKIISEEYTDKRHIHWSGFSSSSTDINSAKQFAKENGMKMCI